MLYNLKMPGIRRKISYANHNVLTSNFNINLLFMNVDIVLCIARSGKTSSKRLSVVIVNFMAVLYS